NDLLPALRAQDHVYAATLRPARYQGLTELHDLVLDFGDLAGMDSVFLFLTGWIYPTDASINFALAQSHALQVVPLHVQVKDAAGRWRTVIPDLGFPAGKNKTVIADLTGKFLSADTRVRIRTNMEIYWDRAFVAAPALPRGWTRDFLIYTDAWLKDADLNTAAGGTVEPLPFHAMSRYPYGAEQAFPTGAAHRRFVETYNTRRVLTPWPPLHSGEG